MRILKIADIYMIFIHIFNTVINDLLILIFPLYQNNFK